MVHIVQCLCPSRHCIAAIAFDDKDLSPEKALEGFPMLVNSTVAVGGWNPWCGICRSRDWHYELGRTRWETLEEAMPRIKELERQQALTRSIIGQGSQN